MYRHVGGDRFNYDHMVWDPRRSEPIAVDVCAVPTVHVHLVQTRPCAPYTSIFKPTPSIHIYKYILIIIFLNYVAAYIIHISNILGNKIILMS